MYQKVAAEQEQAQAGSAGQKDNNTKGKEKVVDAEVVDEKKSEKKADKKK